LTSSECFLPTENFLSTGQEVGYDEHLENDHILCQMGRETAQSVSLKL